MYMAGMMIFRGRWENVAAAMRDTKEAIIPMDSIEEKLLSTIPVPYEGESFESLRKRYMKAESKEYKKGARVNKEYDSRRVKFDFISKDIALYTATMENSHHVLLLPEDSYRARDISERINWYVDEQGPSYLS